MSESTTNVATTTTPNTEPSALDAAAADTVSAVMASLPMFQSAPGPVQTQLLRDAMDCVVGLGMSLEVYIQVLSEYGTAAEYLAAVEDSPLAENTEPAVNPNAEPVVAEPTATQDEAAATLKRWGGLCARLVDQNYDLAACAAQYVAEYMGCSPGRTTRSLAVERLADKWLDHDEESLTLPVATAMKRLKSRVGVLLHGHAVATLIGTGHGVAKGNGTARGRGKGHKDGRLAWGTLREFFPLVSRLRADDDTQDQWQLLPSVAADARSLLLDVVQSGKGRKDVVIGVAGLMLQDATLEHAAALRAHTDNPSGDTLLRLRAAEVVADSWGGKLARWEAPKPTVSLPVAPVVGPVVAPATPPATVAAPATPPATVAAPATDATVADEDTDEDTDEDSEPDATPATPGECRGKNTLTAMADQGPRALAESMLDLVRACDEPDDTVALLLSMLADCRDLLPAVRDAIRPVAAAVVAKLGSMPTNTARDAAAAAASLRPTQPPMAAEQPATVKIPA